jgi:hypothetical protein
MPTAALIAGGLQAGGQVLGGFQQQAEAKNEATMLQQQGQVESTSAYGEIAANDARAREALGAVNVGAAASGVSPSSGSVRAVRSFDESQAILRDTYTRYKGQAAESNAYYQARAARYQGNQAMWGGLVSGGTTALTSGASYWQMSKGTGSPKGSPS